MLSTLPWALPVGQQEIFQLQSLLLLTYVWCSDEVLEQLQQAFAPGSAFWQAHGSQAPDMPFFSYVLPLVSLELYAS